MSGVGSICGTFGNNFEVSSGMVGWEAPTPLPNPGKGESVWHPVRDSTRRVQRENAKEGRMCFIGAPASG